MTDDGCHTYAPPLGFVETVWHVGSGTLGCKMRCCWACGMDARIVGAHAHAEACDVCAHTHMMMDADLTGGMVDRLMDGMRENVIMCEDVMEMCVSCVTLSETRRASPSVRELVSVWIVIRVMCAAERGGAFWCVSLFGSSRVCAPRGVCPGLG
jgi:hypothetical protein